MKYQIRNTNTVKIVLVMASVGFAILNWSTPPRAILQLTMADGAPASITTPKVDVTSSETTQQKQEVTKDLNPSTIQHRKKEDESQSAFAKAAQNQATEEEMDVAAIPEDKDIVAMTEDVKVYPKTQEHGVPTKQGQQSVAQTLNLDQTLSEELLFEAQEKLDSAFFEFVNAGIE
jgi:hypothetical protein